MARFTDLKAEIERETDPATGVSLLLNRVATMLQDANDDDDAEEVDDILSDLRAEVRPFIVAIAANTAQLAAQPVAQPAEPVEAVAQPRGAAPATADTLALTAEDHVTVGEVSGGYTPIPGGSALASPRGPGALPDPATGDSGIDLVAADATRAG